MFLFKLKKIILDSEHVLLKFRVWNWFKRALKGPSVTSYNMVVEHLLMRWVIWSIKNLESCFFTFLHQRAARRHKLGDLKWCSLRRPAVKMTVFSLSMFLFVLVAITDPFLFPTYLLLKDFFSTELPSKTFCFS